MVWETLDCATLELFKTGLLSFLTNNATFAKLPRSPSYHLLSYQRFLGLSYFLGVVLK